MLERGGQHMASNTVCCNCAEAGDREQADECHTARQGELGIEVVASQPGPATDQLRERDEAEVGEAERAVRCDGASYRCP